jgi:hypothetical protein
MYIVIELTEWFFLITHNIAGDLPVLLVLATEAGDIKEFPTESCYLSYPAEAEDIKEYPNAVPLPLNEVTTRNPSLLCSHPPPFPLLKLGLSWYPSVL